mmetsp:Transcript_19841/g.55334  ORF Transcript_19841/g.55334 Transcript_19841/m.55334 type:complete len:214 (-) Transcript_19841:402-1043(-)
MVDEIYDGAHGVLLEAPAEDHLIDNVEQEHSHSSTQGPLCICKAQADIGERQHTHEGPQSQPVRQRASYVRPAEGSAAHSAQRPEEVLPGHRLCSWLHALVTQLFVQPCPLPLLLLNLLDHGRALQLLQPGPLLPQHRVVKARGQLGNIGRQAGGLAQVALTQQQQAQLRKPWSRLPVLCLYPVRKWAALLWGQSDGGAPGHRHKDLPLSRLV